MTRIGSKPPGGSPKSETLSRVHETRANGPAPSAPREPALNSGVGIEGGSSGPADPRRARRLLGEQDRILENVDGNVARAVMDMSLAASRSVTDEIRHAIDRRLQGYGDGSALQFIAELSAGTKLIDQIGGKATNGVAVFDFEVVPGVGTIKGVEQYSLRATSLVRTHESVAVVSDQVPDATLDIIQSQRQRAGLPTGQVVRRGDYRAHQQEIRALGPELEFYRGPDTLDRIGRFYQEVYDDKCVQDVIFKTHGARTPDTLFSGRQRDLDLNRVSYPVVAKRARSAGGAGVKMVRERSELEDFIRDGLPTDRLLLQELVDGEDISKQYYFSAYGPIPISHTSQIMRNEVEHDGNRVPNDSMSIDSHAQADAAAWAMWNRGYRGWGAADLRQTPEGEGYVIEMNLRLGGVTAPTFAATQAGFSEFVNQKYYFGSLDQVRNALDRFGYTRGATSGALPLFLAQLGDGSVKMEATTVGPDGGSGTANAMTLFAEQAKGR